MGAYALITVALLFLPEGVGSYHSVIHAFDKLVSSGTMWALAANPTPASLRSSLLRTPEESVASTLFCKLFNARFCNVNIVAGEFHGYTRTVRLSGLSAFALSTEVCTFHVPRVRKVNLGLGLGLFASIIQLHMKGSPPPAVCWSSWLRQIIFKAPFL